MTDGCNGGVVVLPDDSPLTTSVSRATCSATGGVDSSKSPRKKKSTSIVGFEKFGTWKDRWRISLHGVHVDHTREGLNKVRRFVVIESPALRRLMKQPQRTEIEPLIYGPDDRLLRTSRRDELADEEAKEMLVKLYERIAASKAIRAEQRTARKKARLPAQTTDTASTVKGYLLFAGKNPAKETEFFIEVSIRGKQTRIVGPSVERAWIAAESQGILLGDPVAVSSDPKRKGQFIVSKESIDDVPGNSEGVSAADSRACA